MTKQPDPAGGHHDAASLSRNGEPNAGIRLSVAVVLTAMIVAGFALRFPRHAQPVAAAVAAVTAEGSVAVAVQDFAFAPANLTVHVGTSVVWTNLDQEPHTVRTTTSATLASTALQTNATYAFTFTTPGTFAYHCSIHPEMHGVIVVTK